uniref:Uncharacterized protein n=1 Tax=Anguilla anguilla TaxID=7936 RepID=A0A0E9SIT2_ANGAN
MAYFALDQGLSLTPVLGNHNVCFSLPLQITHIKTRCFKLLT